MKHALSLQNTSWEHHHVSLHGMVTIGPKAQIVIPSSVRKETGVKPGDQLLILVKLGKIIALVKANEINELHAALHQEMRNLKKAL